jgi:hypothetical protein
MNKVDSDENMPCPICKSAVSRNARVCPMCLSRIAEMIPTHGGICPQCRSNIDAEALRCLHCKSWLVAATAARTGRMTVLSMVEDHLEDVTNENEPDFGEEEPPWRNCKTFLDMSTFDVRTGTAWVIEECVYRRAGSGEVLETTRRPVRRRTLSQREIDRWMAENA